LRFSDLPLAAIEELKNQPPEVLAELIRQLEENVERAAPFRKLFSYYPDDGPLRRVFYPRHMEFFAAGGEHELLPTCPDDCDGKPHRDRLALCANRVGKTEGMGGYETALHLTGHYPDWWVGHRFDHPISAWAAGKTNESTRDIIQTKLLGAVTWRGREKLVKGTGLVPADDVGEITWKRGVANLIDTVRVRHVSGGWSELGLKAYEQGRGAFEGTEKHLIWFDEEPPVEVYEEAGIRLMTTRGHMLLTFTPMEGMSQVVLAFIAGGSLPKRVEERAGWLMDAIA
jgi:phage terminase large subunit-like protein